VTQDSTLTSTRSVPADIAHLAGNAGLGAFQRAFVPKRRNWFALFFMFLIALATTFVLVGFWLLWILIRTPNLSPSLNARRLYLYENGFVIVEKPDDPQVFRWDGIDTVFQKIVSQRTYGVETARTYLYTVTRRDGRVLKLTQFWDGIARLGPTVNERVSSALLPVTLGAIERGQGVQFGDMALNANGIAGRRKSVTWREVSQVQIYNGYVRVGVAGRFFSLSTTAASNIPNLPLFLALTDGLRRRAAAG
jgi:hypothetical protein